MLKSLFGGKEVVPLKVPTPDGDLEISKEESDFYGCGSCASRWLLRVCNAPLRPFLHPDRLLFRIVDSNCDGSISGAEGASFLGRSGLTRDQLREVRVSSEPHLRCVSRPPGRPHPHTSL